MLVADTGREAPEAGVKFYRAAGWEQEDLDRYVDGLAASAKLSRNCRTRSSA